MDHILTTQGRWLVACSSAPTGLISFALMQWGLRKRRPA